MADKSAINDSDVEATMGLLLRIGVMISAAVVLAGCLLYLSKNGTRIADHHKFFGEPSSLTHPRDILRQALALQSDAVIQSGLILLILTPIARIVFSIIVFLIERDILYVVIGALVLAIIACSYIGQLAF